MLAGNRPTRSPTGSLVAGVAADGSATGGSDSDSSAAGGVSTQQRRDGVAMSCIAAVAARRVAYQHCVERNRGGRRCRAGGATVDGGVAAEGSTAGSIAAVASRRPAA